MRLVTLLVLTFSFGCANKTEHGITASPGEDGVAGEDGAPGEDGEDGAPGEDGDTGAPGEDGEDADSGGELCSNRVLVREWGAQTSWSPSGVHGLWELSTIAAASSSRGVDSY